MLSQVLLAESAQKRAVVLRMQHSQLEPALLSALRLAHWPESDVELARILVLTYVVYVIVF